MYNNTVTTSFEEDIMDEQIAEKPRKKSIIPNILTSIRLVGAIVTIFLSIDSPAYYIVYGVAGLTDAFDGMIARKTNSSSQFGSVLDSIADLVFYAAMAYKFFMTLWEELPLAFWILLGVALAIRVVTYAYVYVKHKKFDSIHTYGSKLTGALTFLIPFYYILNILVIGMMITVIVGILASLEQMLIHFIYKGYDESVKTIFLAKKKQKEAEKSES